MKSTFMQSLKEIAPLVAFNITASEDNYFSWDGDGPDPREEGLTPYDSDVSASVISKGETVTGHAYLGGSYYNDAKEMIEQEISGYLPQMAREAAEALNALLPGNHPALPQLALAIAWITEDMQRRYDEQMSTR